MGNRKSPAQRRPYQIRNPQSDLNQSFLDEYQFVDTVMSIPIDESYQIRVILYKQFSDNKELLDIRYYRYKNEIWNPSIEGIRFPMEFLPQLVIRLQALNIKHNKETFKIRI